MSLLEVRGIRKIYGKRVVVKGVDFDVDSGEIVGLLGPNGAGKTTCFRITVGLITADSGAVHLGGRDVSRLPMYKRARAGMGYLPQESSVFRKLTVEENLLAILEFTGMSRRQRLSRARELLTDLDLARIAHQPAYTLSGGERRRLEITRALVSEPKLMLLDEPFSGIAPIAVFEIQEIVRRLRDRGMGILVTDHNVREMLAITNRSYLLNDGSIFRSGSARELIKDPDVRRIYLGEKFRADELMTDEDLLENEPAPMPASRARVEDRVFDDIDFTLGPAHPDHDVDEIDHDIEERKEPPSKNETEKDNPER